MTRAIGEHSNRWAIENLGIYRWTNNHIYNQTDRYIDKSALTEFASLRDRSIDSLIIKNRIRFIDEEIDMNRLQ